MIHLRLFNWVLPRFQHYFSYLAAIIHLSLILGLNKSIKLGYVPCPRARHNDRDARRKPVAKNMRKTSETLDL